ncbi:hypothetical protein GCM10027067_37560 [Pseudactinotalea suaedae]
MCATLDGPGGSTGSEERADRADGRVAHTCPGDPDENEQHHPQLRSDGNPYRHRISMMNPTIITENPIARFQPPIPGIG